MRFAISAMLALAACSTGSSTSSLDLAAPPDMFVDKAAPCAATFGTALTAGFGRLDGIASAVVKPSDQQCTAFNNDHVVLQVTVAGTVYRMVINVQSDRVGDQRVRFAEVSHAATGVAFAEGWHLNEPFDYVTTLAAHNEAFAPLDFDPLVTAINDRVQLGQKISVYSTTSGGGSAHLIHRNKANQDGAIVLDPDGASPKFLLFHFAEQTF